MKNNNQIKQGKSEKGERKIFRLMKIFMNTKREIRLKVKPRKLQ